MNKLILAAAALAIVAAPGLSLAKAAPKYDCTNPHYANKAQCKAAVAGAAATTTTVGSKGAAMTTTVTPSKVGGKPATAMTTTVTTAKGGTLKVCGAQWDALSANQKGVYNTQATTMKSKKGGKLSGYNVFTGECMKKK
jgi:hypothetical protein